MNAKMSFFRVEFFYSYPRIRSVEHVMKSLRVRNHSESLANHKAQQFKTLLVLEVHYK